MMRKTIFSLILVLVLMIVVGVAFAQNFGSDLSDPSNDEFLLKDAPVRLTANEHKFDFDMNDITKEYLLPDTMDKASFIGYTEQAKLPAGATRTKETILTWGQYESLQSHVTVSSTEIAPKRIIYYVETEYPIYEIKYGSVEDATVSEVWDYETGECLGSKVTGKPTKNWSGSPDTTQN